MTDPTAAPGFGTLGALRQLTDDLPDDTPIQVSIRKAHDPDHFYDDVRVEDESVDLTHGQVVVLHIDEPQESFGDR